MATGTVKKLVSDRGFGFLAADDGKEYLDGEIIAFTRSGGEKVEFEVGQSQKGPQAQRVRLV